MTSTHPGTPEQEPVAPARLVRSYTLTAGRTRAVVDLPVEATLRRLDDLADSGDTPLERVLRASDGCSVAEVSAAVNLPLGVARVLLGDLVEGGRIEVQATLGKDASHEERRSLIERTLRGLHTL